MHNSKLSSMVKFGIFLFSSLSVAFWTMVTCRERRWAAYLVFGLVVFMLGAAIIDLPPVPSPNDAKDIWVVGI